MSVTAIRAVAIPVVTFLLTCANAWTAPVINTGGIVSAANGKAPVARGSLVSIYGTDLSAVTQSSSDFPLPTNLGGTQVKVNGTAAPLIFVSSGQINFQMPFEAPINGTASVTVSHDNATSPAVTVALVEFAPGIFRSGSQPIVLHADYSLVTSDKPAIASEILVVYGTGVGGLNSLPVTGQPTPASPLVTARIIPTATIGGQNADVLFTGLAAGFAGLAQFNIRMPAAMPSGPSQPLAIAFGTASDSVAIALTGSTKPTQVSIQISDVQPHRPLATDFLFFQYVVQTPHTFSGTLTHYLFFSKNSTITATDNVIAFADGTKTSDTEQWTFPHIPIPDGTTPGRYYVAVGVAPPGDTNPADATLSATFPLDVVDQRGPFDLNVTLSAVTPVTVAAGSPIVVSYSVREPSGFSGTFSRSVYIAPQSNVTTSDTLLNTRTFDLVNGHFDSDSSNNVIPATLSPGKYWVAVIVDSTGDKNPANNISTSVPITVTAAPATSLFGQH